MDKSDGQGMPPLLQVGIRYTAWQPAGTINVPGKGEFPQRFAPGAFDRHIGKIIPLKFGERPEPGIPDERPTLAQVRVVAAEVAEDGSGVHYTYEIVNLEP